MLSSLSSQMARNPTHMRAPRKAMISTAMAAEMTPSPRSSPATRRAPATVVAGSERACAATTSFVVNIWTSCWSTGSLAGEHLQRLDEGHRHEQHPGQQRGHRDGDPHLLGAPLDGLDQLAVHVAADDPGLLGHQPSEVARV